MVNFSPTGGLRFLDRNSSSLFHHPWFKSQAYAGLPVCDLLKRSAIWFLVCALFVTCRPLVCASIWCVRSWAPWYVQVCRTCCDSGVWRSFLCKPSCIFRPLVRAHLCYVRCLVRAVFTGACCVLYTGLWCVCKSLVCAGPMCVSLWVSDISRSHII